MAESGGGVVILYGRERERINGRWRWVGESGGGKVGRMAVVELIAVVGRDSKVTMTNTYQRGRGRMRERARIRPRNR